MVPKGGTSISPQANVLSQILQGEDEWEVEFTYEEIRA